MNKITSGLMSSNTDNWATPNNLFEVLDKEFNFNLDPCADDLNHKCSRYYTKEIDGLSREWGGDDRIFMNPPYGKEIKKWVKKAYESSKNGALVVALLPARTDTKWFSYCMKASEIRFIEGRVKFGNSKTCAPFPSCIVIWGIPRNPIIKSMRY